MSDIDYDAFYQLQVRHVNFFHDNTGLLTITLVFKSIKDKCSPHSKIQRGTLGFQMIN